VEGEIEEAAAWDGDDASASVTDLTGGGGRRSGSSDDGGASGCSHRPVAVSSTARA
jgi:hypothetical protein